MARFPTFAWTIAAAALSGCAAPGEYPSLAPRAVESELAGSAEPPPASVFPDEPGLDDRLAPLLAAAREGEAAFEAALAGARTAVGRAGGAGSDSWVEAQQAISRAEAARARTTGALADLDALALAEARRRPLGPGDLSRLDRAVAEVQALASGQHERIAALEAALRSR